MWLVVLNFIEKAPQCIYIDLFSLTTLKDFASYILLLSFGADEVLH